MFRGFSREQSPVKYELNSDSHEIKIQKFRSLKTIRGTLVPGNPYTILF